MIVAFLTFVRMTEDYEDVCKFRLNDVFEHVYAGWSTIIIGCVILDGPWLRSMNQTQ